MDTETTKVARLEGQPAVLIVGGGLVGLSSALFLSWYGIPVLLVERHADISPHPRASGFNARTLELFRTVGIEPLIRSYDAPEGTSPMKVLHVESLIGKELSSTGRLADEDLSAISPTRGSMLPQSLLEPILRKRARELGADIRFNTELVSCEQDAHGIHAVIRERETGNEQAIFASYLIAADGSHSPLRNQLGIGMSGPGQLARYVSILFQTDISDILHSRYMAFCFVENPQVEGTLGFSPDGRFGMLFALYQPEKKLTAEDLSEAHCTRLVQAAIGAADRAVKIFDPQPWELAANVADRYQEKRIFLVGDAAHVMPPTGGLGANTGIQDAYNLAWKLAFVLKGNACPALLNSYEAERRPIAQLTVEQTCLRYAEHISHTLPIERDKPLVDLTTVVFGYRYHSMALCHEPGDDEGLYEDPVHPSGCPGTRAPHVLLTREGRQLSILDLLGGDFVLFTGPNGTAWQKAATAVAEALNIDLETYTIGSDLHDVEQRWYTTYGVSTTGAVLVRPDGFIGWRAYATYAQPEQELEQALMTLLARN